MKLKCTFEPVDMGEETIMVPVGAGAAHIHGIIKLNKAGQEIVELLKEETSEEAITNTLVKKFDNDREILKEYVQKVVAELRKNDLIED